MGGYYDRTLAAARPRPWAIGLGFELGRLDSIRPMDHDVALDGIVTESGWVRHARADRVPPVEPDEGFASPACLLSELDRDDGGPWR